MILNEEDRLQMIKIYFDKATKSFNSSLFLCTEQSDYDGATNRAYYSMFLAEKALLLTKGISGDSHKHTHMSVSKEFVKDGEFPKETYQRVKVVEGLRHTADYSGMRYVTKNEACKAISESNVFLIHAEKILLEIAPHAVPENRHQDKKIQDEVEKIIKMTAPVSAPDERMAIAKETAATIVAKQNVREAWNGDSKSYCGTVAGIVEGIVLLQTRKDEIVLVDGDSLSSIPEIGDKVDVHRPRTTGGTRNVSHIERSRGR